MVALIHGSSMNLDARDIGHVGGIVQLLHRAVVQMHAVDDAGRGGDEIEIEFALQPLADDFQMQQAQKSAAEAEAQRGGGFGFVGEARIVQMQLAERFAQILELRRIDRKQSAEHHLLRGLEAGQGCGGRASCRR